MRFGAGGGFWQNNYGLEVNLTEWRDLVTVIHSAMPHVICPEKQQIYDLVVFTSLPQAFPQAGREASSKLECSRILEMIVKFFKKF